MRLPFPARRWMLLLLCAAVLTGCSSSDAGAGGPTPSDAAPDITTADAAEASPDAEPLDAAEELSSDAAADAQVEAAEDDAPPCVLARPYSQQDPECNACAESKCCAEINTCLLDPACDDSFVNCMLACTIDADAGTIPPCIDDCAAQYPTGKAEYDVAVGCADSKCAVECQ